MNLRLRPHLFLLGMCLAAAAPAALAAGSASEQLAAAVADKARPEADRARDADRKPAEVIALTGMHSGAKIAEILPGGGYFTRIFSKLVGPTGTVYAWVPLPAPNAAPGGRDMAAPMRALAADANYANIKVAGLDPATPLPEKVDLVWTSLNYHDMRARPNADLTPTNKMVFDALKPGGLYMVIDHAANKGAADAGTLHRVDPELVKQDVTSVGFKLVQESNLLRHSADDRTKPTRDIDRGKTDQFVLLFQKPAG
jgi:predicted methyltransferase